MKQQKLETLQERLHKIRRTLRGLPLRQDEAETELSRLLKEYPTVLAKHALNEVSSDELEQFRQSLADARRAVDELAELEKGLLQMEQVTLKLMKPLQRKKQRTESERQYDELKARLEAGNYNRDEIEKFRQVAHELSYDKEASELLRRIEHVRNREMKFSEVYGLRPEGVNDAI